MDGILTPDTRINDTPRHLIPEAVQAAEIAVDHAFETLERTNTSLPDWADFNLFGALFGHLSKKQTRLASNMTIEQFSTELWHIVQDVRETAEGINNRHSEKSSGHIDVETLTQQIQSVADAALDAASRVMQSYAGTERIETPSVATLKR